jgi:D-beta-D-heptose 7-phosphate kinase/D-beta-D-heptose 1-phosphate adenosyltransferase
MKEYIDDFNNVNVLVIGDIMLDSYVWGDVSRISPEAPVPIVDVKHTSIALGGAANVVNNILSLGGNPIVCGVVGEDKPSTQIMNILVSNGLQVGGIIVDKDRRTTVKTRVVGSSQHIVRFDSEDRNTICNSCIEDIISFVNRNIDRIDVIIISDYGKGVISYDLLKQLRAIVEDSMVPIIVDPNIDHFDGYYGVDCITPNHKEAGLFCGKNIVDEESLFYAARDILNSTSCKSLLITKGKDGMTLFESEGEIVNIPTVAKEVFDVSGAGDTVVAVFSLGLAIGMDYREAALLSNYAAGIVVGKLGTAVVEINELKSVFE